MNLSVSLHAVMQELKRSTLFELLFLLGTLTSLVNGLRAPGFGLGISELSYLLAFVALISERVYRRVPLQRWLPWHPFWLTSLLLFIGGLFSSLIAGDPLTSIFVTFKAMFVFSIWMSMAILMVTERHKELALVTAACIGPLFSAAISIWDARTFSTWGPKISSLIGNIESGSLLVAENTGLLYGRFAGITGHPNIQSEYLITVIPLVLVGGLFALRARQWKKGIAFAIFFVVLAWSDILAGSVTGMLCVALAVGIALLLGWLRISSRTLVPTLAGIAAVAMVGLVILSQSGSDGSTRVGLFANNANITRALDVTGPDRFELMGAAFRSIERNPFAGYGMDLMPGVPEAQFSFEGQAIHNAILRGWLYGGIIFFVGVVYAYLCGLGLAFGVMWRYLKGADSPLLLGLAISTVVWTLNDMTQPVFYQRFTWLTVAIIFGLMARQVRVMMPTLPPVTAEKGIMFGEAKAFSGD